MICRDDVLIMVLAWEPVETRSSYELSLPVMKLKFAIMKALMKIW